MQLHEHGAKRIIADHGVLVPKGILISKVSESDIKLDLSALNFPVVLKAQVFTTDRAKLGGIRFATNLEDAVSGIQAMMGSKIKNSTVTKILIEEKVQVSREIYVSFLINFASKMPTLIVSEIGGTGVEHREQDAFVKINIDPLSGLQNFSLRKLSAKIGMEKYHKSLAETIRGLYAAFQASDAEVLEVNPLALNEDGHFVALDAKMSIDDYAAFRTSNRIGEEDVLNDFEGKVKALGIRAVRLDGDIAVISIGAGALLLTLDTLSSFGGKPIVAVDLRMDWDKKKLIELIKQTVSLILDLKPKAILVNVFLSLARSDFVSEGLVLALDESVRKLTFVRIQGNTSSEARRILSESGIYSTDDLGMACQNAALAGGSSEVITVPPTKS